MRSLSEPHRPSTPNSRKTEDYSLRATPPPGGGGPEPVTHVTVARSQSSRTILSAVSPWTTAWPVGQAPSVPPKTHFGASARPFVPAVACVKTSQHSAAALPPGSHPDERVGACQVGRSRGATIRFERTRRAGLRPSRRWQRTQEPTLRWSGEKTASLSKERPERYPRRRCNSQPAFIRTIVA
jgi:hypothetical protein